MHKKVLFPVTDTNKFWLKNIPNLNFFQPFQLIINIRRWLLDLLVPRSADQSEIHPTEKWM